MLPAREHILSLLLALVIAALPTQLIAADPGADAAQQMERGLAFMEIGDYERAEAVFRELIRLDPLGPEAYNNLAVVLAKRGRYDEAQAMLDRALQSDPAYGPIFRNLRIVGAHRAGQSYSRAFASAPPSDPDLEVITQIITSDRTLVASSAQTGPTLTLPSSGDAISASRDRAVAGRSSATASAAAGTPSSSAAGAAGTVQRRPEVVPIAPVAAPVIEPISSSASSSGDPMVALIDAVDRWRSAWAAQDVGRYITAYSATYHTPGMQRSTWLAQRHQRLTAPDMIDVVLSRLSVDMNGQEASVRFRQRYRSDAYQDEVEKTLIFRMEGSEWRIVAENSTPVD